MKLVTFYYLKLDRKNLKNVYLATMVSRTFAIITDIHSNLASLTHAISLIEKREGIDQIICLGDCFALGPEPEETLKMLKSIPDCIFIRGNHDRYLVEKLCAAFFMLIAGVINFEYIKNKIEYLCIA